MGHPCFSISLSQQPGTADTLEVPSLTSGIFLEDNFLTGVGERFGMFQVQSIYCALFLFPGGSVDIESACNAEDSGSIPGSGRSPGEGNGNPLQYLCLENPMDRGTW